MKQVSYTLLLVSLICLSFIGWYVLLSQKVDILILARWRYIQILREGRDLTSGPCLGKLKDDWVLDVAHIPREPEDNLLVNQCADFVSGKAHHFVEMTPKGEIVTLK